MANKKLVFKRFLQLIIISSLVITFLWHLGIYWALAVGLDDQVDKADVIVIFGTSINPDGQPSRLLRWRLDDGAKLYQQGQAQTIIVSGGTGNNGFDEAAVMHKYLIEKGVPDSAIVKDSQGETSYKTVQNTVNYLKAHAYESVIVVSDYEHLLRIKLTFYRFGISKVYGYFSDVPMYSDVEYLKAEVVKLTYYQFFNYE